jgi:hypothetical protein
MNLGYTTHHYGQRTPEYIRCGSSRCIPPEHHYNIEHDVLPAETSSEEMKEMCKGAVFDNDSMGKVVCRQGRRVTGEVLARYDYYGKGGFCEEIDDPSCPPSFAFSAFVRNGCEERNGTLYWKTYRWNLLLELLRSADKKK